METALSPAASQGSLTSRHIRLARVGDELLAGYAARGSERAFVTIYERYHQPLYAYCRSILRNDEDARDALQGTFAAAFSALRRRQRNAPLKPWLFRIAHNQAITLIRRRGRTAAEELEERHLPAGPSAEDAAAERARWALLVEDLGELPERLRGALLLRELSGLSHEEIAVALGINPGGAKQALLEARKALAEFAEGRTMECEEVQRRISDGDRRVLRGRRVSSHLRGCSECAGFTDALVNRRADLRAFTPVLPAAAASMILGRAVQAAGVHSAVSGASAAGASASCASAPGAATSGTSAVGASAVRTGALAKVAGTTATWKAITGAAVIAVTASAGVVGVSRLLHHQSPATRAARAAPTGSASRAARSGSGAGAAGANATHIPASGAAGATSTVHHSRPAAGPAAAARHHAKHGHNAAPASIRAGGATSHGAAGHGGLGQGLAKGHSHGPSTSHGTGGTHRGVGSTRPHTSHAKPTKAIGGQSGHRSVGRSHGTGHQGHSGTTGKSGSAHHNGVTTHGNRAAGSTGGGGTGTHPDHPANGKSASTTS
jgi:RNA polymerase sigma factor (sigma-70 family)